LFKGSRKYWFIALFCGLIAAFLSYQYLQEASVRYMPDDLIKVVKASKEIEKDSIISSSDIEVVTMPAKYTHPDVLRDKQEVVGRVATADISAGEQVLNSKVILDGDVPDRLSYTIPESKRAVSIPINEISGVSGFIEVGDRVDIIATLDIPVTGDKGTEKDETFSILALQNIEVLAIGNNSESSKKSSSEDETLTLAVSVQEAQPLVLASERGNLRLLLRSPVDDAKCNIAPMQLKDFIE